MASMSAAYSAATWTWQNGPQPSELDVLRRRYMEKWQIFTGELFADLMVANPYRNDPAIYANTKLLWKHAEAIVRFYEGMVYRGALSDEPEQGAIPIKPVVKGEEQTARLMLAINTLHDAWNWQQQMSYRPMYAAALGDCLTELVDNRQRGFVYPRTVWPGFVTHIELDDVDNVQGYILEYRAEERKDDGTTGTYQYRKEVDKESFRHYREDKPWDKDGPGTAVVPNPYGFVPAIWDRHHVGAPEHVRGLSALDGTRQALLQMNSIWSHAFDFQRRAFFAPIMVAGGGRSGGTTEVDLSQPDGATASDIAQSMNVLKVPAGAQLLQPQFDIGKTREMLADLAANILDENPEAAFYQRIREMAQVTAPGVAAAQGDVESRLKSVRAGADVQTIKLLQMAITMCGILSRTAWQVDADGRRRALTARQQVFTMFDEQSFARGEMEFKINDRPMIEESEAERIERVVNLERIQTVPGLVMAGMTEDDARALVADRNARYAMAVNDGTFGQDFTSGEGQVA